MRNIKAFFLLACMLGSVVFVNAQTQNKASEREVREQLVREKATSAKAKPVVQASSEARAAERNKNKTAVKSTRPAAAVNTTTKPNAATAPVPSTAVQIQRAKQAEIRKSAAITPQKGSN